MFAKYETIASMNHKINKLTSLCEEDLGKLHFIQEEVGFTRVYTFFFISALNHSLCDSVYSNGAVPTSSHNLCFEEITEIRKISHFVIWKVSFLQSQKSNENERNQTIKLKIELN